MMDQKVQPETACHHSLGTLSDPIAMCDLIGRLAGMKGEAEIISEMVELFQLLFPPGKVCYLPMISGKSERERLIPQGGEADPLPVQRMGVFQDSYRWEGEDWLTLRVGSSDEPLGIIEVRGIAALPDCDPRLKVACGVGGVGAAAIRNARMVEQLSKLRGERENFATELAGKNRELESVLYAASHDLRSPLVNIQGFAKRLGTACNQLNGLLQHAETPVALREQSARIAQETVPKALWFINTSIAKMDALIGGLLALSRVGRVILRKDRLDMDRLLRLCVASMEIQMEKAHARIDIKAPLPACLGDPTLLSQVFSNLLDNALKYRHADRQVNICVSGQTKGSRAVYCIADNGIGIPAGQGDRIWDLFFRLEPNGPIPGEGLGLNMVHRIVERHEGRVWMESIQGEGSRFFVAIPADPEKAQK